jgi:hypothetical protein
VSAREGGVIGVRDPDVLGIAAESGRFSFRMIEIRCRGHFARSRETRSSPGLIIVSQDLDIGAAIDDLLLIWQVTEAEEWLDQIGFVPV